MDLRTHLGQLALAIFRREINELPSRDDVLEVFCTSLPDGIERGRAVSREAAHLRADDFLRRIAEATGLLVIHSREVSTAGSADIVSFMHHSFLEYYAAIGFLARDFEAEMSSLATNPHWRDVITLMFGLWSEHNDITGLMHNLLDHAGELEPITNERLLLALACSLECDVPPQETLVLISGHVHRSLIDGAMKYSEHLRATAARPLSQLIDSAGMDFFEPILLEGIGSDDASSAAAFVDFLGLLEAPGRFSGKVVECFETYFADQRETVFRIACIGALARRAEFRSDAALAEFRRSLNANVAEKHAALRALEGMPSLAPRFINELLALLDDNNSLVASEAARCILTAGVTSEEFNRYEVGILKAVARWRTSGRPVPNNRISFVLDQAELTEWLASEKRTDVERAAMLLPLSEVDDKHVHKLLVQTLQEHPEHSVKKACLDSLRLRRSALDLITLAETDYICGLVWKSHHDVRIAALRVLGMLPNDEQVISTLREFCGIGENEPEVAPQLDEEEEGFRALAEHARSNSKLQRELATAVLSSLPKPKSRRFGDEMRQRHRRNILAACESIGAIVDHDLSSRLLEIAENFRSPQALRVQALRVYGKTVMPDVKCVKKLSGLVERDDRRINDAAYTACYWFLVQCRKRLEYVRSVAGDVDVLKGALIRAWARETARRPIGIDPVGIGDIRRAVTELEGLRNSYEEYSEMMKLSHSRMGE